MPVDASKVAPSGISKSAVNVTLVPVLLEYILMLVGRPIVTCITEGPTIVGISFSKI